MRSKELPHPTSRPVAGRGPAEEEAAALARLQRSSVLGQAGFHESSAPLLSLLSFSTSSRAFLGIVFLPLALEMNYKGTRFCQVGL